MELTTFMPMKVFLPFWTVALGMTFWTLRHVPVGAGLALFAAGLAFWTIIEYLCHRHLFHAPCSSRMMKQMVFLVHGNHHDMPADALRNMMPLSVTVPVALGLWYFLSWLGGELGRSSFAGFLTGYVIYDLVHYYCHQGRGRGRLARFLKHHHLLHHHGAPDYNFGVSSALWDRVFKTRFRGKIGRNHARRT